MVKIIFENNDFVVIDKPHGISFHSEEGEGIVVQTEKALGVKLFSVHRLDKMTSGLLILAKSSEIANIFTQMFASREISKFYLAISTRKPKKKQGWVKADMAKSRRGSYKLLQSNENPAITQFVSMAVREGERAFLIKPHTGKTHQIRVALKSVGAPIAGDERYAAMEEASKEERGYLHAYYLAFKLEGKSYEFRSLPSSGERFLSKTFENVLELWKNPLTVIKVK